MKKEEFINELEKWKRNQSFDCDILDFYDSEGEIYLYCDLTLNDNIPFKFVVNADFNNEDKEIDLNNPMDFGVSFILNGFSESLELYKAINELNIYGYSHNFHSFTFDFELEEDDDDDEYVKFALSLMKNNCVGFTYKEYVDSVSDTLTHALNVFSYSIDNYEDDFSKNISKAFDELLKLRKTEE